MVLTRVSESIKNFNMRCHYIKDRIAGKVLIPGCMSAADRGDISFCCCPSSEKTLSQRVFELETTVKELKKDIKNLNSETE